MFAREIDKDTMIKDSIDWHLVSKDGFPTESGVYYVMRINPYLNCDYIDIHEERWYNDRNCFDCSYCTDKELEAMREKDSFAVFAWAPYSISRELLDEAIKAFDRRDAHLRSTNSRKV